MPPQQKNQSTTSTSLPVGLRLLDGKDYKVGKKLSSGAFGSVYAVTTTMGNKTIDTEWVVKIVPIPAPKTKSRKPTDADTAHGLLWNEHLLYSQHLVQYCGSYLPNIPRHDMNDGLRLFIDNRNGYRCLVLERMDALLLDAFPTFVKSCSKSVDIGSIAVKFIKIAESFHKAQHLILDVKPENIMVTNGGSGSSKKVSSFVDRIRILDLGLVKCYLGPTGHKPDEGIPHVNGTPQYASLNVHDLHTPSRRDDIESFLYLIGELIIRAQAINNGSCQKYEKSATHTYLPWSNATSDKQVGDIKRQQVNNLQSEYYKRMPTKAATKLFECWSLVRSYKYTTTPQYEVLCDMLKGLAVPVTAAKKTERSIAKKQIPAEEKKLVMNSVTRPALRMTRSSSKAPGACDEEEEAEETPRRPRQRRSRVAVEEEAGGDECPHCHRRSGAGTDETPSKYRKIAHNHHQSSGYDDSTRSSMDVDDNSLDSFHSTMMSLPEQMVIDADTEDEDDEEIENIPAARANTKPSILKKKVPSSNCKNKKTKRLKLTVLESGTVHVLEEGVCETLIVGSDPKKPTSNLAKQLVLQKNNGVRANHAKLDLKNNQQTGLMMVNVTDLKSGDTFVGQNKIPTGKSIMAFTGNQIRIGSVLIEIK